MPAATVDELILRALCHEDAGLTLCQLHTRLAEDPDCHQVTRAFVAEVGLALERLITLGMVEIAAAADRRRYRIGAVT